MVVRTARRDIRWMPFLSSLRWVLAPKLCPRLEEDFLVRLEEQNR